MIAPRTAQRLARLNERGIYVKNGATFFAFDEHLSFPLFENSVKEVYMILKKDTSE